MSLTADELRSMFAYNAETGLFTRLKSVSGNAAGPVVNVAWNHGYITIQVRRGRYRAHRLAWLYVYGEWPSQQIDHINGVRSDNRIANLREATSAQNNWNRSVSRISVTGVKGVYRATWNPALYCARIKVNGKPRYLGAHPSVEAAADAYNTAAALLQGDFAKAP